MIKMNIIDFFKRWGNGIKNLSPERQLKSHISGAIGNIIGFTGGIVTMSIMVFFVKQYHLWWTVLILVIALFTTIIDLIGKKQQLHALQQMQKSIEDMEDVVI